MMHKTENNYPVGSKIPEIKVINCMEELAGHKEEWKKILTDNRNSNPFLEFDWIENWWNFFGKGHSLFVLVMQMQDRIVGFCPFMIMHHLFFQEIAFIGYPDASYMDFILAGENRDRSIEASLDYIQKLRGSFILHLHGIHEEAYSDKVLINYFNQNKGGFFVRSFEDPFIPIDRDFTSYLKKRSKYSSIKTLIRSRIKLESVANVTYKQLSDSEFDDIIHLYEKKWKKKYDASNFLKRNHQDFFRTIADDTIMSFRVMAYGLKLGNRLIAFIYGFLCNGTYYLYRISHDNDFSVYGPGKIILMKLIEDCFQNNILVVDLGLGYARYKSEWTDEKKIIHEYMAPFASGYSRLFFYKYLVRKKAIDKLKKMRFYDTLKASLLGIGHCLYTGVYYREIINNLIKFKNDAVKYKLIAFLKKTANNLFLYEEYMIYEKAFDNPGNDTGINNQCSTDTSNKVNMDFMDIESNRKDNNIINEANLNDLDLLCEIMTEKPVEIVQHFYKKQRCFLVEEGCNRKKCIWINYNEIEISDINNHIELSESSLYIDMTEVTVKEASMNNLLQIINSIINIIYDEKYTNLFIGIKDRKGSLKTIMISIGFKPALQIIHRKILFKSYVKTQKNRLS